MTEKARERLLELKDENAGLLTPHMVIAEAQKKKSPLHRYFTWDMDKAAYSFWVEQARDLIQSIRVEYMGRQINPMINVVVTHKDGTKTQGYMGTIEVLSDKDLRDQVLQRALEDIERWEEKYHDYKELSDIIDKYALQKVKVKVKR